MSVIRTHKIALVPNERQEEAFRRHAGYRRVAFNHMLADFKDGLNEGVWRTWQDLRNRFNAVKNELYGWNAELSQSVANNAAVDLREAIKKWRDKKLPNRFPKFAKRANSKSFRSSDRANPPANSGKPKRNKVEGRSVWIPRVGWVKTREPLRFDGRIRQITIARAARRWYAVISVEVEAHPEPPTTGEAGAFGMDVGVRHMAILSDGRLYANPKPLEDELGELRRLDKAIARSKNVHGANRKSRRRLKLYRLRALVHDRVANLRRHYHRAVAADIAKSAERIVVEDLNAAGIVKGMGRAAADVGLGGFLLEVAWQCEKRGVVLEKADRWFPSSKLCSRCGVKNDDLRRSARTFRCANCGLVYDRDLNAAINLKNYQRVSLGRRRGEAVNPASNADGGSVNEASTCESGETMAWGYQPNMIPA